MSALPEWAHQEQFGTPGRQKEAATLAIWVFLGTELLIFAVLFVAYGEYRYTFSGGFHAAGDHMEHGLGLGLTAILLTSSYVATLGVRAARGERHRATAAWILLAMALGLAFLVLHLREWAHHAGEGALPGHHYRFAAVSLPGAAMFFTLYYLTTGLHMIHVAVGLSLLAWVLVQLARGRIRGGYDTPVEVTVLYWHFVDVIWTFLFPLYYLLFRR